MNAREVGLRALAAVAALLAAGGTASYVGLVSSPTAAVPWIATLTILCAAALVLVSLPAGERRWAALAGVGGFAAELLGVHFHFPFGVDYRYTDRLALQVASVPVALAGCWVILLCYAREMAAGVAGSPWSGVVVQAAWMMAIDLVLDPVATRVMGLWEWGAGGAWYGVPLNNFAWWFAVSLCLAAVQRPPAGANRWVAGTGLGTVAFFTAIALGRGMRGAAAVGLALVGLHALVRGRLNRLRATPEACRSAGNMPRAPRASPLRRIGARSRRPDAAP